MASKERRVIILYLFNQQMETLLFKVESIRGLENESNYKKNQSYIQKVV